MRRLLLSIFAIGLAAAALLHSAPAGAQVPTPEQLEMLKTLTPEQREALLRQITGGGTSSVLGGTTSDRDRERAETERAAEAARARALERPRAEEEEEEFDAHGNPLLKGDDWVVINIDLPRALPGQAGTTSTATGAQQPSGTTTPPTAIQLPGATTLPQAAKQNGSQQQPQAPGSILSMQELELSREELEKRKEVVELVRSRNPYRLTSQGVLLLPGFAPIPLAGLTEFQATVRLQADPELRKYDVALVRLPLKKIGVEALKPFGYDLFDRAPSSFAPVTNVPVPADYVVGPGDEFEVQLYGNQNRTLRLIVGRDGRINFPELGPISVGGQRFTDVKQSIEARVERQMIGVRASVSMGDTRSIRVYVLGDAKQPGAYTISGLGTITSALYAAGGVKTIGSLRHIQLKRQGKVVREFDLYDMLLRGDSTDDAKLLPGDVVFVPPVGPTVTVAGEVKRPAIYEVKSESTVADVIALAGGLNADADPSKAALTRIDDKKQRVVLTVNLSAPADSQTVRNGDVLTISKLRPTLDSGVRVDGYVYSPATYAWHEGLRLTDVIHSIDELKPNADIHYLLIRRELPPNREIAVVSADLGAALAQPGSDADVMLMPRDRITVFDLQSGRERIIRPLLEELRTQGNASQPTELVKVEGEVKVPGEYPLEPGMTVRDLIRAGGGLDDSAYVGRAELTRYRVIAGDARRTEVIPIDLAAVLRGDANANIRLEPYDSLSIKEMPEWESQGTVTLEGEVRFPGKYSIKRGETLRSVLARAGGLTDFAFPEGAVFTREELREREQKELDLLSTRLQNDLVTLAMQGAAANQQQAGTALAVGQSLLAQVRATKAVGRLVIDLPRALRAEPGSWADIVLRDGDRLLVPRFQQEVTVIGEVQTATSHLYRPELSRDDYIAQSGGMTRRADADKIYVVRADGSVVANNGGRWFSRGSVKIKPGDTIVVPLDTERMPALPFWQAVTSIIYNLAISAAAVNSF